METAFERAYKRLLGVEGEWSNHKDDPGGQTRWGVTEAVAREEGWAGSMVNLPLEFACKIAMKRYWLPQKLDLIASVDEELASEMFETGYNLGVYYPVAFLQRALNAFNQKGAAYADVAVDGKMGLDTLSALRAFLRLRGEEGRRVLLRTLNVLQGARYIEIAEKREANESFVYGWLRTRVEV